MLNLYWTREGKTTTATYTNPDNMPEEPTPTKHNRVKPQTLSTNSTYHAVLGCCFRSQIVAIVASCFSLLGVYVPQHFRWVATVKMFFIIRWTQCTSRTKLRVTWNTGPGVVPRLLPAAATAIVMVAVFIYFRSAELHVTGVSLQLW